MTGRERRNKWILTESAKHAQQRLPLGGMQPRTWLDIRRREILSCCPVYETYINCHKPRQGAAVSTPLLWSVYLCLTPNASITLWLRWFAQTNKERTLVGFPLSRWKIT